MAPRDRSTPARRPCAFLTPLGSIWPQVSAGGLGRLLRSGREPPGPRQALERDPESHAGERAAHVHSATGDEALHRRGGIEVFALRAAGTSVVQVINPVACDFES